MALNPQQDVVIWLGHSVYYIQLAGKRILIDPVLSDHAASFSLLVKAFKGSTLYKAEDIPEIDYLLIFQDHYDYLDYATVIQLKDKVKNVFVPLGIGSHFEYWDYPLAKIHENDWFDTLRTEAGLLRTKMHTASICGKAMTLQHNGDLYACDHFVYPAYKLGNILNTHEGNLAFSGKQQEFAYAKSQSLPNYCKSCEFLNLCFGECPKNRFITAPTQEAGLNYLCEGLKIFYRTALQDLSMLQQRLGQRL